MDYRRNPDLGATLESDPESLEGPVKRDPPGSDQQLPATFK